ncbi:MAG: hypothetical protein J6R88_02590, partial [Clostridia bacterium]|nr:hypothetical protein [Clostridia bacterium]
FLNDELIELNLNEEPKQTLVSKPKLFEPIALTVFLLSTILILSILCFILKEFAFVPVLIIVSSIGVPLSIVYFCYRLNTRNDVSFLDNIKYLILGFALSILINLIFSGLSDSVFGSALSSLHVKSAVEIVATIVLVVICLVGNSHEGYPSALLVSSVVSAGFIIGSTATQLFNSLFISFEVQDGTIVKALGAIINSEKYLNDSINSLVYAVFKSSVVRPAVFICSVILSGFAVKYVSTKPIFSQSNNLTGILLFPVSVIIYFLSEFFSSIFYLQFLYNSISIVISIFIFYKIVNYTIKTENYKQ